MRDRHRCATETHDQTGDLGEDQTGYIFDRLTEDNGDKKETEDRTLSYDPARTSLDI